jgi:tRNA/rRNA methyltransferase
MSPEDVRVVLVEPQGDANVGAVARSLACFGVGELMLVNPRAKLTENAFNWAVHGKPVLEATRICTSLAEAVEGTTLAVALTARHGKRRHRMVTPSQFHEEVWPQFSPASRLALVFGNEESGLDNASLDFCQRLIKIPTQPGHTSLNLAHSVTIMLYELLGRGGQPSLGGKQLELATAGDCQRLLSEAGTFLAEWGYPSHQATLEEEVVKLADIAQRSRLEAWEIRFLLGMLRHIRNVQAGRIRG